MARQIDFRITSGNGKLSKLLNPFQLCRRFNDALCCSHVGIHFTSPPRDAEGIEPWLPWWLSAHHHILPWLPCLLHLTSQCCISGSTKVGGNLPKTTSGRSNVNAGRYTFMFMSSTFSVMLVDHSVTHCFLGMHEWLNDSPYTCMHIPIRKYLKPTLYGSMHRSVNANVKSLDWNHHVTCTVTWSKETVQGFRGTLALASLPWRPE